MSQAGDHKGPPLRSTTALAPTIYAMPLHMCVIGDRDHRETTMCGDSNRFQKRTLCGNESRIIGASGDAEWLGRPLWSSVRFSLVPALALVLEPSAINAGNAACP